MARARCKARTKAKKKCRNLPIAEGDRCRIHTPVTDHSPDTGSLEDDVRGPNESAIARVLDAMGPTDDEVVAARMQMLRSLAAAVDWNPTRAALWSEYREALKELTDDDGDSALERASEALRRASEVGNT